ncbi:MAG TPA: TetR/AcrR family transcriptional regulator [Solirubrobacterales bacterium]|nr:TetR/AcrR family transcriptional regulator [Solirubrobacterales bacterium]
MSEPAYRRMDVDERRKQLLERGAELFTSRPYDELSMKEIAAEVGISKALLYHYFPSKQAFFEETLGAWAEELRQRTAPDPDLPPVEQLTASLDAFLAMVEENAVAYRNLMDSATGVTEIRDLVDQVRRQTAERILQGLYPDDAPPKARIAVNGWLWFMDGACLNWIEHRDVEREELRDLLLGVLMGSLVAGGALPDVSPSA